MIREMKCVVWLKPEQMSKWDAFVGNHPFGWISHLSSWKKVLEMSFKHIKGHFLAIWDDDTNSIVAGLPIYTVRSWLTGSRLVSVPFITHGEALISSPEHMEMLLPPIFDLYKKTKASYIELNTWRSTPLIQEPQLQISRFYRHHYITLDRDPEELKKTFHKSSIQRKISRAIKGELQLKLGEDEKDLCSFYDIFSQTRKRLGLPPIPYKFFLSFWQVLGSTSLMTVLLVAHRGQYVASSILLKFGEMVVLEFNCDTGKFRNLGVNQFCDWEAIKLAYREGYKIFSFGRTSPNNKGLMTHKARWGTTVDDFSTFFYPGSFGERSVGNESSWKYRLIAKMSEKAPGALFQILGKLVYRHMG